MIHYLIHYFVNNNLEKCYLRDIIINFRVKDLPSLTANRIAVSIILNNLKIENLNFSNYISSEDVKDFGTSIMQNKSIKNIIFKVQGNLSQTHDMQLQIFKRLLRNPN